MNSFIIGTPDDERDRLAEEARELADQLGDRAALFMLELGLATTRNLSGGWRESPLVPAQRAVEIAKELPLELQVAARFTVGNVLWQGGRVPDGLRATEEALELAGGDLELGVAIQGFSITNFSLYQKACLLMWRGRPHEAGVCFERSREVAGERNEDLVLCVVNCWSGAAFEELTGSNQQALERGHQAFEQAERLGAPFALGSALQHLGWAQLMHGQVAEALELLLRLDHLQRERGIGAGGLNIGQGLLAEAHLAAGDEANARIVANRCTAQRDTWVYELRAHLSRSRVLRALDGADARIEIEDTLERAHLLLEKSGARAFGPFIIEERARLLAVLGDSEGAAQHLREAQRAFAELEATGHAERLERELEELRD